MTKAKTARKLTAMDVMASTAPPLVSSVTGQFMALKGEVFVDDQTDVEVLEAGKGTTVASGSTICVFAADDAGQVAPRKIHATQDITLTGPLIWARLPTVDILPLITAPSEEPEFTGGPLVTMIMILGALYLICAAPASIAYDYIHDHTSGFVYFGLFLAIVAAAGMLIYYIIDKIETCAARQHKEILEQKFSTFMQFESPDITSLSMTSSAA